MLSGNIQEQLDQDIAKLQFVSSAFFFVVHVYPLLTTKRIALLSFERDVCTRLGIAFFEVSVPSVFHVKVGASR